MMVKEMKLTGKCKQDFEAWINDQTFPQVKGEETEYDWNDVFDLGQLPVSMQFAIIQEFADSLGYYINDTWLGYCCYSVDIVIGSFIEWEEEYDTRKEAQQAAIAKFNEIYNKQ